MANLQENQDKMLKLKHRNRYKKAFDGQWNWTQLKKKISRLEGMSMEIPPSENQWEKLKIKKTMGQLQIMECVYTEGKESM